VSVYGAGMKFGMFAICDEGVVNVETVHNGIKSNASFSTNPKSAGHVDVSTGIKTNKPSGTVISISNVQVTQLELEKIYKNMSVRYYPALEVIPGIELYLPDYHTMGTSSIKVEFEDPFYRHLTDDEATYVNIVPEEFKLGNDTIPVTRYSFVYDKIVSSEGGFINWDSKLDYAKHTKAGFTMGRSGVFIKIGFRYATIGDGDFIFNSAQMNYNNLRIEIDIPVHHANKFLQINKSKSQLQKTGMDKLQDIIKEMTRDHQSERCPGSPLDVETQKNLDELNAILNDAVKKVHHANLLELNDISASIPDEDALPRKEHQGGTKYQPSFKKSDEWYELRYEEAGINPHYRASKINKKLIITLNNNHPYVYNYLRKLTDVESQKIEGIKLYSHYTGLAKARVIQQFDNLALQKVIESESDELRKFFLEHKVSNREAIEEA
jgi:hypothetical protein